MTTPRRGRVLGVDPGTVRLGLALTDPDRLLAMPHATIPGGEGAAGRVVAVAVEHGCTAVVVGLPRSLAGRDTDSTRLARMLAAEIEQAGFVVHLHDERLTSVQADRALRAAGRTSRQTRGVTDQVAAQLLLQAWLDAAPTTPRNR
jgi:putative Holliday junction resolvase